MCCMLTINDTRVVNGARATHMEVKPMNNDTRVVIPLRHRIISALGSNNVTCVLIHTAQDTCSPYFLSTNNDMRVVIRIRVIVIFLYPSLCDWRVGPFIQPAHPWQLG